MNIIVFGLLFLSIILIFLSALLSASETAFFSLDELKLRYFTTHEVKVIRKLNKQATLLLAAILIGNTTINILLTTVLETWFKELGYDFTLVISTIVVSGIIILFGEILPKTFATVQIQTLIPFILFPLNFILNTFSWIAKPINRLSTWLTAQFSYLLPESENKEDRRIALYNIVSRGTFLKDKEKLLIGRVLSLAERRVTAVMTPRPRVFSVEDTDNLKILKEELAGQPYSKIPVYREKDSNIIGALYFEDIAMNFCENRDLDHFVSDYMVPIYYVPESKTLGNLLEDFREKNIRIAAVVDEYGDCLGIITLSDIMAELVGEVVDDIFEKEAEIVQQLPNRYIVDGEVSLIDFNEKFATTLVSEEYETIAGFLIEQAGGIPPLYYTFENGTIVITVRVRTAVQIKSLSVRVKS